MKVRVLSILVRILKAIISSRCKHASVDNCDTLLRDNSFPFSLSIIHLHFLVIIAKITFKNHERPFPFRLPSLEFPIGLFWPLLLNVFLIIYSLCTFRNARSAFFIGLMPRQRLKSPKIREDKINIRLLNAYMLWHGVLLSSVNLAARNVPFLVRLRPPVKRISKQKPN